MIKTPAQEIADINCTRTMERLNKARQFYNANPEDEGALLRLRKAVEADLKSTQAWDRAYGATAAVKAGKTW